MPSLKPPRNVSTQRGSSTAPVDRHDLSSARRFGLKCCRATGGSRRLLRKRVCPRFGDQTRETPRRRPRGGNGEPFLAGRCRVTRRESRQGAILEDDTGSSEHRRRPIRPLAASAGPATDALRCENSVPRLSRSGSMVLAGGQNPHAAGASLHPARMGRGLVRLLL